MYCRIKSPKLTWILRKQLQKLKVLINMKRSHRQRAPAWRSPGTIMDGPMLWRGYAVGLSPAKRYVLRPLYIIKIHRQPTKGGLLWELFMFTTIGLPVLVVLTLILSLDLKFSGPMIITQLLAAEQITAAAMLNNWLDYSNKIWNNFKLVYIRTRISWTCLGHFYNNEFSFLWCILNKNYCWSAVKLLTITFVFWSCHKLAVHVQ